MTSAESALAKETEVKSPCISVCVMDPIRGYCVGCYRTLDEIADCINFERDARLQVFDAIKRRKATDEAR